jgi:hypothetical protein
MLQHRFSSLFGNPPMPLQPSLPALVAIPMALMGCPEMWSWQRELYQWAYQKAQEVVEPSWIERDVLGVWN